MYVYPSPSWPFWYKIEISIHFEVCNREINPLIPQFFPSTYLHPVHLKLKSELCVLQLDNVFLLRRIEDVAYDTNTVNKEAAAPGFSLNSQR